MGQTKRLIISLIVLLSFAAAGFVPTLVTADDGARFTLPARHQGDRVDYVAEGGASLVMGGALTVEEPMLWKDADGVWHRADVMTSVFARFQFFGMTLESKFASLVDGDDWEPLAASMTAGSGSSTSSQLPLFMGAQESRSYQDWGFVPGETFHPCGILNGLQGATEWTKEIRVGGRCNGENPSTFRYQYSTTWNEAPAMVYGSSGEGSMELTFAAGIPYPVRMELSAGEGTFVAMLSGFHRGSSPVLFPATIPDPTPMPAIGWMVPDRYGPSLGAVDDVYPIQEAVAAAAADPAYSDVRDFMALYPDWRVSGADIEQQGQSTKWVIDLSSTAAGVSFRADREPYQPMGEDLPLVGPQWTTTHSTIELFAHAAPPLSEMPQQVPDGADIVRAWQIYAETNEAPTAGGFSFGYCGSYGCGNYTEVRIGATPQQPPGDQSPLGLQDEPQNWEGESVQLGYSPDGLESIQYRTSSYQSSGGILSEPTPAAEGDNEESGVILAAPAATAGLLAGIVAALAVYLWPVLKTLPGFALFSRIQAPQLLEHPSRQRIVGAVEAEPGIHFKELQRKTGLANGTLRHHTRQLGSAGLISERSQGGFTCFYAGASVESAVAAASPVLKSAGARQVLDAIRARPGITSAELQHATGLVQGTVGYHLKRLRDAGLVDGRRNRRTVHLYASGA